MKNKNRFRHLLRGVFALLMAVIAFSGCDKNPAEPDQIGGYSVDMDVAESVASALGEDTGGLTDQLGDLIDLTASLSLKKGLESADYIDTKEATYDETTGTWTLTLLRERGNPSGMMYAKISRIFTYQFLNQAGTPQKFYITDGDTARTIKFAIVEGQGRHQTRRLSQQLKTLEGNFTATNAHLPNMTMNGTYKRAAVDTITTLKFQRIHDHQSSWVVTDLVGPRGSRKDLSQKLSGTITGTYHADVTFIGEQLYREKTVDRTITITVNNGESQINVTGTKFVSNLKQGELNDN